MKRYSLAALGFALLLITPIATAETVLLPVLANDVHGAFGSVWTSSFSILNRGTQPLLVRGAAPPPAPVGITLPIDEDLTIQPQQTLSYVPYTPDLVLQRPSAKLLHVDDVRVDDLAVYLRIQDTSRQSQTFGTAVPTVRGSAATTTSLNLLSVPSAGDFRSLLRVYDFNPAPGHRVFVRIYKPAYDVASVVPDLLLSETTLDLSVPADSFNYPGYAELGISLSGTATLVRIEVVAGTPQLRFWAFASVTNNATQHVTLVTP